VKIDQICIILTIDSVKMSVNRHYRKALYHVYFFHRFEKITLHIHENNQWQWTDLASKKELCTYVKNLTLILDDYDEERNRSKNIEDVLICMRDVEQLNVEVSGSIEVMRSIVGNRFKRMSITGSVHRLDEVEAITECIVNNELEVFMLGEFSKIFSNFSARNFDELL
jgi:hypothetical protein